MAILTPAQSLNKAFRQVKIASKDFNNFVQQLKQLLDYVNNGQTEETQKKHLTAFLNDTFYSQYYIAPEGTIDFAIHLNNSEASPIGLVIEVKSTTNKNEMVTKDDLNRKAFQELLLYYLRERVDKKNNDLKYLIATNVLEFFIFDAQEFEKYFYNDKELRKEYEDFREGRKTGTSTEFFYSEIAQKYIRQIEEKIDYTYFDLRDYVEYANNGSNSRKLIELYKVISDTNLLKLPFQNDSNTLNKNFYDELLHIIGLEEITDNNKKIITRKRKEERNDASLIENAINILDSEDRIDEVKDIKQYGDTRLEQLFNVSLELCITWINRLLFLKLLEAQLIKYHRGDKQYSFLNIDKIPNYDALNRLFFRVLAVSEDERTESVKTEFKNVPYLNSSLFEITKLEKTTIGMSGLMPNLELPLINGTVLKDKNNRPKYQKLTTLRYLFEFLDAYDFASEGTEGVEDEAKTLINASVLGLIFEKINGHKDGSIFTPGKITMYMCKETIQRAVVNKFNEHYNWNCADLVDVYNKIEDREEANRLINSLTVCDPAVGSGHYLVTSLNEIIRIKYELGVLVDSEGKCIRKQDYSLSIDNDELIITDEANNLFCYNSANQESQRIQETLFNEKRYIIENCLFGVDINPNSVNICRLRLWIELLKNSYYTKESNYTRLETLPNIDINIKCGDSLVSRFDISTDIKDILRNSNISIADYKKAVMDYKSIPSKEKKHELSKLIIDIKSTLKTEIDKKDAKFIEYTKNKALLKDLLAPTLFDKSDKEKRADEVNAAKLRKKIKQYDDYLHDIELNRDYKDAFEWRIEFPEILNDVGDFMGFDVVIGNPPYIQLQTMGNYADTLGEMGYDTYARTGDIYCLFIEKGWQIIKEKGLLCFITSNKWMRAGYGETTRDFLSHKTDPIKLIDFAGVKIFDAATVDTDIILFSKSENRHQTEVCKTKDKSCLINLGDYFKNNSSICSFSGPESWVILSDIEQSIKRKIEAVGTPLKDWDINIYRGILTGCNEAFIISGAKRDEILKNCLTEEERTKTAELIRPILRGRDIKRYGYSILLIYGSSRLFHRNIMILMIIQL
jgi:adenine-specific DNA-methyltransferase